MMIDDTMIDDMIDNRGIANEERSKITTRRGGENIHRNYRCCCCGRSFDK